ncbi:hypothetical protein [Sphingopyxis sp.]|uniref:hypothetical protein n=1 Tax=Sphingopyxis sp. TaxID=1908224 RepID=UPI003F72515C
MAATIGAFYRSGDEEEAAPLVLLAETPAVPKPASASSGWAPIVPNADDGSVIVVSAQPNDLHTELLNETRDAAWADRSETAIREGLRGFSFLSQGGPLDVRCAMTICEIRGVVSAPSIDARKLRWQEIEQFTQGETLSSAGLLAAAAVFGTREDAYAFVLHYRRDDALAAMARN